MNQEQEQEQEDIKELMDKNRCKGKCKACLLKTRLDILADDKSDYNIEMQLVNDIMTYSKKKRKSKECKKKINELSQMYTRIYIRDTLPQNCPIIYKNKVEYCKISKEILVGSCCNSCVFKLYDKIIKYKDLIFDIVIKNDLISLVKYSYIEQDYRCDNDIVKYIPDKFIEQLCYCCKGCRSKDKLLKSVSVILVIGEIPDNMYEKNPDLNGDVIMGCLRLIKLYMLYDSRFYNDKIYIT